MAMQILERVVIAARRPERLNNAGICIWCGDAGCESPRCKAQWLASRWVVCPECQGSEWRDFMPCGCCGGVVEGA